MSRINSVFIALFLFLATSIDTHADTGFIPGFAPFTIELNDTRVSHKIVFRTLLPGEALNIKIPSFKPGQFTLSDLGNAVVMREHHFAWKAPDKPGYYPLEIARRDGEKIQVQVFVMQPASNMVDGKLNGYHIGSYPTPLKGLEIYKAPKGFIELTAGMENLAISPHFTLGQFVCKQNAGYPKYLVLRPKLLEKLELLLQDVNQRGIRTDSFMVMSGYRTPFYNRAIQNVTNSRHIFGGAADIYIDINPADGVMDDINGDGQVNEKDSIFLYKIADQLAFKVGREDLFGGIGNYRSTPAHGPFVHVDVRGTRARWGL